MATSPPTIAITGPAANATVGHAFSVTMSVSDAVGIDHVDVSVSGPGGFASGTTLGAAPWQWAVNATTDGAYTATATATNSGGQTATATTHFTVKAGTGGGSTPGAFGSACASNAQCKSNICLAGTCTQSCGTCPTGYTCNASKVCALSSAAPAAGEVGASCNDQSDCKSKICADGGAGYHFCTAPCDPANATSCPARMYCADLGADGHVCLYPAPAAQASGCSLAPRAQNAGRGGSDGWLVGIAIGLVPLVARKRRRGSRRATA
jgi:hypothetical protein